MSIGPRSRRLVGAVALLSGAALLVGLGLSGSRPDRGGRGSGGEVMPRPSTLGVGSGPGRVGGERERVGAREDATGGALSRGVGGTRGVPLMKDEEPRAGLDSDPEPWVELAEVAIEHGSSPVRREQLVEAARDFELVRQAAVEGGVTLEPGQRAALDRLWEEATRRESRVVDAVGFDLEVAARDLRAFETRMLLENLAQARGLPSRHVDADLVLAYFEAHAHELPPLPEGEGRARAWRAIEIAIRQRLAPGVAARHEQGIAALLEELREASPDDGGYGPW